MTRVAFTFSARLASAAGRIVGVQLLGKIKCQEWLPAKHQREHPATLVRWHLRDHPWDRQAPRATMWRATEARPELGAIHDHPHHQEGPRRQQPPTYAGDGQRAPNQANAPRSSSRTHARSAHPPRSASCSDNTVPAWPPSARTGTRSCRTPNRTPRLETRVPTAATIHQAEARRQTTVRANVSVRFSSLRFKTFLPSFLPCGFLFALRFA